MGIRNLQAIIRSAGPLRQSSNPKKTTAMRLTARAFGGLLNPPFESPAAAAMACA